MKRKISASSCLHEQQQEFISGLLTFDPFFTDRSGGSQNLLFTDSAVSFRPVFLPTMHWGQLSGPSRGPAGSLSIPSGYLPWRTR